MTLDLPYPWLEDEALQANFDRIKLEWVDPSRLPQAGDLKMSAAINAPDGWLACDASAVSRATYATLFSAIGTAFGTGDGSTTFNLPDFRGRAPVGPGDGDATGHTGHTFGAKYGKETHTLSTSEIPSHTHPPASGTSFLESANSLTVANGAAQFSLDTIHGATGATGGGGAHENRTPSLTVHIYIKT